MNKTAEDIFEELWAIIADKSVKEMLRAFFVYFYTRLEEKRGK